MSKVLQNLAQTAQAIVLAVAALASPLDAQMLRPATAVTGLSQTSSGAIPSGVDAILLKMASYATVMFTGTVAAIDRRDASGFVDVRFRIDKPIRGCPETGMYVLREWAGRWAGHSEPYRPGQRLLMLLPARGPSGMSAPVFGSDGAIPLVATAPAPIAGSNGIVADDPGTPAEVAVDLRMLQSRVVRSTLTSAGPATTGQWGSVAAPIAPLRILGEDGLVPLSSVLSLLGFQPGGAHAAK